MRISGITYVPRKSYRSINIILFFITIFLFAVVGVMVVSGYMGWKLTHPEKIAITAFAPSKIPDFKDVTFGDVKKSVQLKGWYFQAGDSDKTVILAHGYKLNRLQFGEKTLDMIKSLLAKGYNVLAFDFRNSGESSGKLTTVGIFEKDDLLGAVKYVKSTGSKNVVLMGFSMGAATSIMAAAESTDVNGVIADSPYSDLSEYLDSSLDKWSFLPPIPFNKTTTFSVRLLTGIDPATIIPKKVITKISPRPLLLIHSKEDTLIPVSNSQDLYSIYSKTNTDKTELWETKGTGHVGSYEKYPQEYMEKVFKFLDKIK